MRFLKAAIVGAFALVSSVVAQSNTVYFTDIPSSITAGNTYTIKYAAAAGSPVTITLRKGDADNLSTVSTLTSDSTGGSYTWNVPSSLVAGSNYALQITQGDQINYSGQFPIFSDNLPSSSSSSTATGPYSSLTTPAALSSAASSLSSLIASANSSLAVLTSLNATVTAATVSSILTTPSSNYTMHSSTVTPTAGHPSTPGTGSETASATGSAPTSGAAVHMASPMALIFGAVAAMIYLN